MTSTSGRRLRGGSGHAVTSISARTPAVPASSVVPTSSTPDATRSNVLSKEDQKVTTRKHVSTAQQIRGRHAAAIPVRSIDLGGVHHKAQQHNNRSGLAATRLSSPLDSGGPLWSTAQNAINRATHLGGHSRSTSLPSAARNSSPLPVPHDGTALLELEQGDLSLASCASFALTPPKSKLPRAISRPAAGSYTASRSSRGVPAPEKQHSSGSPSSIGHDRARFHSISQESEDGESPQGEVQSLKWQRIIEEACSQLDDARESLNSLRLMRQML